MLRIEDVKSLAGCTIVIRLGSLPAKNSTPLSCTHDPNAVKTTATADAEERHGISESLSGTHTGLTELSCPQVTGGQLTHCSAMENRKSLPHPATRHGSAKGQDQTGNDAPSVNNQYVTAGDDRSSGSTAMHPRKPVARDSPSRSLKLNSSGCCDSPGPTTNSLRSLAEFRGDVSSPVEVDCAIQPTSKKTVLVGLSSPEKRRAASCKVVIRRLDEKVLKKYLPKTRRKPEEFQVVSDGKKYGKLRYEFRARSKPATGSGTVEQPATALHKCTRKVSSSFTDFRSKSRISGCRRLKPKFVDVRFYRTRSPWRSGFPVSVQNNYSSRPLKRPKVRSQLGLGLEKHGYSCEKGVDSRSSSIASVRSNSLLTDLVDKEGRKLDFEFLSQSLMDKERGGIDVHSSHKRKHSPRVLISNAVWPSDRMSDLRSTNTTAHRLHSPNDVETNSLNIAVSKIVLEATPEATELQNSRKSNSDHLKMDRTEDDGPSDLGAVERDLVDGCKKRITAVKSPDVRSCRSFKNMAGSPAVKNSALASLMVKARSLKTPQSKFDDEKNDDGQEALELGSASRSNNFHLLIDLTSDDESEEDKKRGPAFQGGRMKQITGTGESLRSVLHFSQLQKSPLSSAECRSKDEVAKQAEPRTESPSTAVRNKFSETKTYENKNETLVSSSKKIDFPMIDLASDTEETGGKHADEIRTADDDLEKSKTLIRTLEKEVEKPPRALSMPIVSGEGTQLSSNEKEKAVHVSKRCGGSDNAHDSNQIPDSSSRKNYTRSISQQRGPSNPSNGRYSPISPRPGGRENTENTRFLAVRKCADLLAAEVKPTTAVSRGLLPVDIDGYWSDVEKPTAINVGKLAHPSLSTAETPEVAEKNVSASLKLHEGRSNADVPRGSLELDLRSRVSVELSSGEIREILQLLTSRPQSLFSPSQPDDRRGDSGSISAGNVDCITSIHENLRLQEEETKDTPTGPLKEEPNLSSSGTAFRNCGITNRHTSFSDDGELLTACRNPPRKDGGGKIPCIPRKRISLLYNEVISAEKRIRRADVLEIRGLQAEKMVPVDVTEERTLVNCDERNGQKEKNVAPVIESEQFCQNVQNCGRISSSTQSRGPEGWDVDGGNASTTGESDVPRGRLPSFSQSGNEIGPKTTDESVGSTAHTARVERFPYRGSFLTEITKLPQKRKSLSSVCEVSRRCTVSNNPRQEEDGNIGCGRKVQEQKSGPRERKSYREMPLRGSECAPACSAHESYNYFASPRQSESEDVTTTPCPSRKPVGEEVLIILTYCRSWLDERGSDVSSPPPTYSTNKPIRWSYCSARDYANTYLPYLMFDSWERTVQGVRVAKINQKNFHFFEIETIDNRGREVEMVCSVQKRLEEADLLPDEGQLVLLKLRIKSQTCAFTCNFGYVSRRICTAVGGGKVKTDLTILVVDNNTDYWDSESYVKICTILSFERLRHQVLALKKMQTSPLCEVVLNPGQSRRCHYLLQKRVGNTGCNAATAVVSAVIKAIGREDSPCLVLVDTPTGTEGLTVLIPLIERIKAQHSNGNIAKILVCAKNSSRVEEIALRLIRRADNVDSVPVHFALNITPKNTRDELKMYTIEHLVEWTKNHVTRDSNVPLNDLENYTYKLVLESCDVILSPVVSCYNGRIREAIASDVHNPLSCCILDEAYSCTEPESIIPLLYGGKKFILFGDPEVGPEGLSRNLKNSNFHRSMAARVKKALSKNVT